MTIAALDSALRLRVPCSTSYLCASRKFLSSEMGSSGSSGSSFAFPAKPLDMLPRQAEPERAAPLSLEEGRELQQLPDWPCSPALEQFGINHLPW